MSLVLRHRWLQCVFGEALGRGCSVWVLLGCLSACNVYGGDLLSGGGASALVDAAQPGAAGKGGGAPEAGDGSSRVPGSGGGSGAAGTDAGLLDAGDTGGGGAGGSEAGPLLDLIDDLEDGDAFVRPVATPTRNGVWDVYNDGTSGAVQVPPAGGFSPTALGSDVPYANDMYAAYTKGSGFTTYGAFMSVSMRSWPDYNATPTYDASGTTGLAFWAKAGSSSTTAFRVRFVSADTDPRGGKCVATGSQDQLCYNHYAKNVAVTTSWAHYEVRFSDFFQDASGKVFPTINLSQMYAIELSFGPGATFEFWIDDLSFVEK